MPKWIEISKINNTKVVKPVKIMKLLERK